MNRHFEWFSTKPPKGFGKYSDNDDDRPKRADKTLKNHRKEEIEKRVIDREFHRRFDKEFNKFFDKWFDGPSDGKKNNSGRDSDDGTGNDDEFNKKLLYPIFGFLGVGAAIFTLSRLKHNADTEIDWNEFAR